jgi:hypothetical protein
VPALGEHTAGILAELGRDPHTMTKLILAESNGEI